MEANILLIYVGWELVNLFLGGVLSASLVRYALHCACSATALCLRTLSQNPLQDLRLLKCKRAPCK